MSNEFYRFRKISSLLGEFQELENQSIYFADPESLNDPMEGFRDMYWSGDYIVWRNLFKHYLLCLEKLSSLLLISGEEHPISKQDILVLSNDALFPTLEYKILFEKMVNDFFDNKNVLKLIEDISNRTTPIRKNELFFYLNNVHQFALDIIFNVYESNNLIPKREKQATSSDKAIKNLIDTDFIGQLEKSLKESIDGDKVVNALFSAQRSTYYQMDLIHTYNGIFNQSTKNKNLVLVDFPDAYIEQLETLVFPEWYTACFMSECKSSSVWGHYGDNHSGACLIFSSENIDNKNFLNLKGRNGYSSVDGPTYGFSKREFYPINYVEGYGEIDFFRMLGRLPTFTIQSMWYSLDGEISKCADNMMDSEDKWRDNYWNNFYRDIAIKSQDWSYEHEYRLILENSFDSFSEPKDRSLNYEFKSLKGIIFGIKTSKEDKLKILKIIEEKCRESKRDDFCFYQAYYSSDEKCICYYPMNLIKFQNEV
ncbi:DUF2971 domain-containing protein [Aliivibrio fischeri]|uniref:DUF2971 domain-containing protein n=1 Tax=Aliivibrio fischeri TaxID=668 RepID=UPI0012D96658|nr:DUF2971 domain-containing protein [Aliivibrio fischeri]MUL01112.1 DUF2971 domain-containing protein [Aliivibrio fischeri]